MARFIVALLIIVPAILASEQRAFPVSGSQSSGSGVGSFGQVTSGSEVHDKKNFGLNFNSDKGASNQYSNTNAAVGLSGAQQQGVGYVPSYPQYPYPQYPYPQYPYPQYPYPSYPTHAVGSGASINTGYPFGGQTVQAGSGAVSQGYPVRY